MIVDATEIADRILSELEEAGEEELVTLINTVSVRTGHASERATFSVAIIHLIGSGEIAIARESDGRPLKELLPSKSIDEARQAVSAMMFDGGEGFWIDPAMAFDVYAVASPIGLERARRILGERGYQWWSKDGKN